MRYFLQLADQPNICFHVAYQNKRLLEIVKTRRKPQIQPFLPEHLNPMCCLLRSMSGIFISGLLGFLDLFACYTYLCLLKALVVPELCIVMYVLCRSQNLRFLRHTSLRNPRIHPCLRFLCTPQNHLPNRSDLDDAWKHPRRVLVGLGENGGYIQHHGHLCDPLEF